MSDVLTEWAAPLLEPFGDSSLHTFRGVLMTAALVWNAATTYEGTAEEVAESVMADLRIAGGPVPEALRPMIEELIESRRVDYAADPRLVLKTDASDVGGSRRVLVSSAL